MKDFMLMGFVEVIVVEMWRMFLWICEVRVGSIRLLYSSQEQCQDS